MNKEELKQKIIEANNTYRAGESIMSDIEYDELVEQFKEKCPEEYDEFRDSLNEGFVEYGTKVKHPFVMGSLNKVTIEKPNDIKKFLNKYVSSLLNVSAKVDGISCRLHYENGKLIQASTRGNGEEGTDITNKIIFIKNIPQKIASTEILDIRGELVILKKDFASLEGFANPRNATAGIMNRKDWKEDDIAKVSFIAYTVLGDAYDKKYQFALLDMLGFATAWHASYSKYACEQDAFIDTLKDLLIKEHDYETDGLVITDSTAHNETKYRPDSAVAVKGNMSFAISRIIDVEWRGPSKDGKFVPVAQLEPVQLCGTTVSQATLNNLDFIEKMHLKYGSQVKVQKRGEIIPAIVELISNDGSEDIEIPNVCPCCGSDLVQDGPFVWCRNKDCGDKTIKQIALFIKKLDVKHASEATLKKFNILSFDDLLRFSPNKKKKSELTLAKELQDKVFTKSKKDLLAATNFEDLSEVLINKIVDFYGFDNIANKNYDGYPDGVGDLTLDKFKNVVLENLVIVDKFINDSRYNCLETNLNMSKVTSNGMSVCFTGKLNTMSRSEASALAEQYGYEVKNGVNKGLTYLVTNDPESGSSKNKKAKEFGTKVITEEEFIKLVSDEVQTDILSL